MWRAQKLYNFPARRRRHHTSSSVYHSQHFRIEYKARPKWNPSFKFYSISVLCSWSKLKQLHGKIIMYTCCSSSVVVTVCKSIFPCVFRSMFWSSDLNYINSRDFVSDICISRSIHNPFIFILVACTYYWADSLMMQITKACHGGFPLERYHVLLLMMKKGNIFHLYRLVLQHQCKRLKI